MTEFKPCPFCGDMPILTMRDFSPKDTGWKVVCRKCQAYIQRWADNQEEAAQMAIEAWNRRTEDGK